jgi:hypothetical protein
MKRSFLLALCLSAAAAFAGVYDIADFTAKDAVMSDNQVFAANGGQELSTASVDEAAAVPSGNIVLRQKFAQESGLNAYQLYIGSVGDVSSMTALSVPTGTSYSDIVKAKLYARRGMKPGDDAEKVYFDGKSVYAPGLTTAVVFIDGSPVTLKGDAPEAAAEEEEEEKPVAAKASSEEECDEYDPDCEDEDAEDLSAYKTSAPVDNTADDRDYAASDAARDVGDRFGIADEVRFWTAVGLTALAVTAAVVGVMQHSKANEAKDAYDELSTLNSNFLSVCSEDVNPDRCQEFMSEQAKHENWTLKDLQARMDENKKTQDSYASARNIWFGVSAAAIAGAVVLFVW